MKIKIICIFMVLFVGICQFDSVKMAILDKLNGFSNISYEIRHGNYENVVEEWRYMWEFK